MFSIGVRGDFLLAVCAIFCAVLPAANTTRAQQLPPAIQLPPASHGKAYNQSLTGPARVPQTWAVTGGALPPGLHLSPAGVLSGAPTAAGNFAFTVRVTEIVGGRPLVQTHAYVLRVQEAARTDTPQHIIPPTQTPQLAITTGNQLPPATQGKAYNDALAATGGKAPYHWSMVGGNLPAGVTLSPTGALSGTPIAAGNFSFTIALSDSTSGVPLKTTKSFALAVSGQAASGSKVIAVNTALTATGFPKATVGPKTIAVTTSLTAAGFPAVALGPKTIAVTTTMTAAGFPNVQLVTKTIAVTTPLTANGY